MGVQSIIDLIQAIARQRGRGDAGPLMMLRQLDGAPGERISHLPVDGELAQAWVAMTSAPFRPHHAQALTALRRGEPVALAAADPDVAMTAHLLVYATLIPDPQATALVLASDDQGAQLIGAQLDRLNHELPYSLRLAAALVGPDRRAAAQARIVIATPEALHARLLRHHDRAWRLFWSCLRIVALPEIQRYAGVAGAHLADLLLRLQRVAAAHAGGHVPSLLATTLEVADLEPALEGLLGQPWRVVAADDGPRAAVALAVWRGTAGRLREAAELAATLRRQGHHVHILCAPLDAALVTPLVSDLTGITYGPEALPAQVLVAIGYPGSQSALRRLLRSGYQAVIVVLGELPHELALARHVESLLTGPVSSWPAPAANAYVTAQHVLCAASEQPLTAAEVEAWGAQEIVARLVAQGQLVDLPDPEVAWKPAAADDPYSEWSLCSSSGNAVIARNEQGQLIGVLDPSGFERWAFPNAALPPGAGGLRVLARDEEAGSVVLRPEANLRHTYPLRRCQVTVRDTRDTRMLAGAGRAGWGRVVVDEEIYGYREATPGGAPAEIALKPPLAARWIAPACWFELPMDLQLPDQLAGWSLAAALSLRALATFTDVVPCYDPEARRIYLVDAQPGGNGLAAWVYTHAEELLPLAYDVALACRGDALLEPLSRVDMDWLLALLGRRAEELPALDRSRPAEVAPPPARSEEPLGAPPALILSPAPPEAAPGRRPAPNEPARPARGRDRPAAPDLGVPRPQARGQRDNEPDARPDPAALIARLRRQREQREATRAAHKAQPARHADQPPEVEPRFAAGERVFCLPYGDGVVQASRVENGREVLTVVFPDYGELTIDPSVSLVRKLADMPRDEGDP